MSRTYRNGVEWKYNNHGDTYTFDEFEAALGKQQWRICNGWTMEGYYSKRMRDGHPGVMTSPPKGVKRLRRHEERAKMRAALEAGRELPRFRTRDRYDWW